MLHSDSMLAAGRLPDFLIIGSAKSGTTTLYEYLCRHPQIFMSTPKEPEFFARPEQYNKGLAWYCSLFQDAQPDQLCGEASTIYSNYPLFPGVPERLHDLIPDVKIIYLMREPVSRTYSFYAQEVKRLQRLGRLRKVHKSLGEEITKKRYYKESGDYMLQIEQYLTYFEREQLYFIVFEHFMDNISGTLAQIADFLGISNSEVMLAGGEIKSNVLADHIGTYTKMELVRRFKRIPGTGASRLFPRTLRNLAIHMLWRSPIGKKVESYVKPRPISDSTRAELIDYFAKKRPALESFLEMDLSCWDFKAKDT